MSKKKDRDIFLEAIKGAVPLAHNKVILKKKEIQAVKKPETNHSNPIRLLENATYQDVNSETILNYKQPSISHKILRNLQKGQYNIDAMLDLHGMTVEKARIALETFLRDCIAHQDRVVLIIHGKSRHRDKPVLKNKINNWLRHLDIVLAFCCAHKKHGGQGAVYVLLKQVNEEHFLE